jgi:WD40 repeat protein
MNKSEARIQFLEKELANTKKELNELKSALKLIQESNNREQIDSIFAKLIESSPTFTLEKSFEQSINFSISFPFDLEFRIFEFLTEADVCKISQVCKRFSALAKDQKLWKTLYFKQWPLSEIIEPEPMNIWKQKFQSRFVINRNWKEGRANVMTLGGHNGTVTCLRFNEQKLISGSDDGSLILWKLVSDSNNETRIIQQHHRQIKKLERLNAFQGHGGPVWCVDFQENTVVSGSYDKTIKVWNLRSGSCSSTLRGHDDWVSTVQIKGNMVVSGSWDNSIKIWDIEANHGRGRCLNTLVGAHGNAVYAVSWDQHRIASANRNSIAQSKTFSFLEKNFILTLAVVWDIPSSIMELSLVGHEKEVYCIQMKEQIILTGSADKKIKLWDRRTGECMRQYIGHANSVMGLQFDDEKVSKVF